MKKYACLTDVTMHAIVFLFSDGYCNDIVCRCNCDQDGPTRYEQGGQ